MLEEKGPSIVDVMTVGAYGGFGNRKLVDFFERFAEVCFKRYKNKVNYWMTFNEINNL